SKERFPMLKETETACIEEAAQRLHLSRQNIQKLYETAADLHIWEEPSIIELWDETGSENMTGKTKSQFILNKLFTKIEQMRCSPIAYTKFSPPAMGGKRKTALALQHPNDKILGRCPVAGEKTRCCNLETLDAVKQCGFACSYCSIQSFYGENRVYFHRDLAKKLDDLNLDPDRIYHIGTGQSSDSLMWGDQNGLLSDLFAFAAKHPNLILELKTKSSRTEWIRSLQIPKNVIATWSLNPQPVIDAEEHYTASLRARLAAARTAADAGIPVGFHLHPMVWYTSWKEDYGSLLKTIQNMFSPEEIVMLSLGTLTFIRPVIKKLRNSGRKTKTTQIPLSDAAGKLSYPPERKQELFSFAYNQFSPEWKQKVFFYLCMENHSLWEPVFGFSYNSNEEFEAAMKSAYLKKIQTDQ
ncbi:MAG: DNA repair photolyase, partial [Spirochaetales bacterium]|nr:DNA repair photolyase [Spirochaetales bacterium]